MGSIRGEGGAGGGGGGGLADLVDDTTPQLGGNLDVNGFNVGGVTPTELGYLSGATSAIQTQLGNKQASNANLDALAGQTGAADRISYWTAAATLALATLTAFGRSLIAAADAAGVRTLLGLGTAATTDASAYQASDAELSAIAGLTSAADKGIQFTGSGTAATYDLTAAGKALLDDADASAQRTTLGLGTAAVAASGDFAALSPATTARNVIQASAINAQSLTVKQIAGQSVPVFALQNSSGSNRFRINSDMSVESPDAIYTQAEVRNTTANAWKLVFDAIDLASAIQVSWKSSSDVTGGSRDTGLGRDAAGVLKSTNGSSSYGAFKGTKYESTITTGTAPLTVASTTVVTNLNADKLDGKDATDFAPCTQATLTAAASVALDFAAAGLATLTTNQNTTFTTSNRAAGRQPYNLRIIGGGAHTLTFPAGWKWLNSTMPAAIASGKTGRLCLECYGTADTDVVASFAVEA